MSALAFHVHVDKENETPAAVLNKGDGLKTFGSQSRKLTQLAPRKALFDVNNGPQLSMSSAFCGKEANSSRSVLKPSKAGIKISSGIENQIHFGHKKADIKTAPQKKNHKKIKRPEVEQRPPKVNFKIKADHVPPLQKESNIPNDEEYDSDSIFPRSQRLSSYVDKLFAWRPPCLFGSIPDSESDLSEPEDLFADEIDFPVPEPEELEPLDLDFLDVGLPVPLPEFETEVLEPMTVSCAKPDMLVDQSVSHSLESPDLSLNLTPDTSLSLGSLHVMHGSLDTSALETEAQD